MKKLLLASSIVAAMGSGLVVAQEGSRTNAMYAQLSAPNKLTIAVSGACSGTVNLDNFVNAGVWNVVGSGSTINVEEQLAGTVAIFTTEPTNIADPEITNKILPIMAGSFGAKNSYSLAYNTKKGETFKVTGPAEYDSKDVYRAIAGSSSVTCKNGKSFEENVAKYPSMGALDMFLPFAAGSAQYTPKASKVTLQLSTDGDLLRETPAQVKQKITITGSFNGVPKCTVKGALTETGLVSAGCKAAAPINVKITATAEGPVDYLDLNAILGS